MLSSCRMVLFRVRMPFERYLGFVRDVTDRKRIELDLVKTRELFRLFIKHSPIYSFIKEVTPTESRTLYASDNYELMIGLKGSDMVGKTMAELFPAEFAEKMTADKTTARGTKRKRFITHHLLENTIVQWRH